MRILLALKQRNYLTTFAGVVDELLRRGHAVRLAWPDDDLSTPEELIAGGELAIESWKPKRADAWAPLASTVRRASDYLRYLEPVYRNADKLRARAFDKMLHSLSHGERECSPGWSELGLELTSAERGRLKSITELMEDAMPSDPRVEARIAAHQPDVVLVSPLIDLGSSQTDIVKSARRLGIPIGMLRKAQGFYDALHHSAALVGLNTSAALEAAVAGRPVFTILAGDAADGQASMLRAFAASFLRPAGWSVPASCVLADAVEAAYGARPS